MLRSIAMAAARLAGACIVAFILLIGVAILSAHSQSVPVTPIEVQVSTTLPGCAMRTDTVQVAEAFLLMVRGVLTKEEFQGVIEATYPEVEAMVAGAGALADRCHARSGA